MKAIIFDTETTGIDNPEIIEAAWIPFEIGDGMETGYHSEFHQRYKPSGTISWGAMAVHHIHPDDLVTEKLKSSDFALPSRVEYLIGHNVDFDWKAAGQPDVKRICTLALSRKLYPEMDSHSQSAMMYRIFGSHARDMLKNAHAALDDVRNCKKLLCVLIAELKGRFGTEVRNLEHLWRISESARIPSVMPFGKHKGLPIKDVPNDYIQWLLKQPDNDPYLIKALTQ